MKFRSGRSRSPLRDVTLFAFAAATIALAAFPRAAASADWPQTHSDLRGDPAVLFGTLPTGMRYAIMRNDTPKGAVSMWLVHHVSGSLAGKRRAAGARAFPRAHGFPRLATCARKRGLGRACSGSA